MTRFRRRDTKAERGVAPSPLRAGPTALARSVVLGIFLVSGISALIYETLWQRMMTLAFGASAPASTAILTSFFLGLGLGTLLVPALLRKAGSVLRLYAGIELAIALAALAVPFLLRACEAVYVAWYPALEGRVLAYQLLRLALSVVVVLPATMAMGATLPVMSEILRIQGLTKPRSIATAYGLNTLGSVLGCLATGFVLIQSIGLRRTYLLAAILNLLVVLIALAGAYWGGWARREAVPGSDESAAIAHSGSVASRADEMTSPATARRDGAKGLPRGGRAIDRERPQSEKAGVGERTGDGPAERARAFRDHRAWLALYFVSGALAIGYEIVWLRILAIYNSSSIVTFTLTLSVYLLGFACGSLVLFRLLSPRASGEILFALSHLGAGASALITAMAAYSFPALTSRMVLSYAQANTLTAWNIALKECLTALVLVLPATVFLGMTFPALCQKLEAEFADAGRLASRTYSIGTFGAALGGLLYGLVFVSAFGLVACMAILAGTSAVIGIVALTLPVRSAAPLRTMKRSTSRETSSAEARLPSRRGRGALVALALVLVLASGVYLVEGMPHVGLGKLSRSGGSLYEASIGSNDYSRILRYKEGNSATVIIKESVRPMTGVRRVFIDDQLVASTDARSKIDSKMLAHLPLLLHPAPQRALTVGFGSGGTSWSMTRYGIATEVVEIEPEVVRSAKLLAVQNYDVLGEKNLRVILDDARNYLHVTTERFDAISTDVTNLQYKQNPYLYTEEYFRLIKARLTASGIACAWVPMAAIQPGEFKILLNSFVRVFPHASLWFINHNFTTFGVFIGTPDRLAIDLERIARGFEDERVRRDLLEIGINHPFQIPGFLQLDEDGIRAYVGRAEVHTDDRPILEFTSPVSLYLYYETFFQNLKDTLALRPLKRTAYVVNLEPSEREEFERYSQVSNMWSYVILNMAAGANRDTLGKAIQLSRRALSLVPDQPEGRKILESLEAQLQGLEEAR